MEITTRLQPHLGKPVENYKPHESMGGYMALAKITKIHHKHGTVDIQLIKNSNRISSSADNEGKYGAKVGTSTAHFNGITMSSSGVVEPLQEGQWVVVGYLDNLKNEPVILCSFHNTWELTNNILPSKYPLNPQESLGDTREALKYLRVFPCQSYVKVDGVGCLEYSHPSGTFLAIEPDIDESNLTDDHDGFSHKDLSEKDPVTGQTRSANTEESLLPVNILLSQKCSNNVFIKAFLNKFGGIRTTRDANDGMLTYYSIGLDGEFVIRRQLDSSHHEQGSNYSKIEVSPKGGINVSRVNGETTQFDISESGRATMSRGSSSVTISESGDISVSHPNGSISVGSGGITVNSNGGLTLSHHSGSYIQFSDNGDIIIRPANELIT